MGIRGVIVPNTQYLFVVEGADYDPDKPACGITYLPVLALELKDQGPPVPYTLAGWPKKPYALTAPLDPSSMDGKSVFVIDGTSGDRFESIDHWSVNKIEGFGQASTSTPEGEKSGYTVQADGKAESQPAAHEPMLEDEWEVSTALSDLDLPKKLVTRLKKLGAVTLSDLSQYELIVITGLGTIFSNKSEKLLTRALHAVNLDWGGKTWDDPDRSTGGDLDTDNKKEDKTPVDLDDLL